MSTRSGKRIHLSFHEDTAKPDSDILKSERKTRSKHTKENFDDLDANPKPRKRNYVAYPLEDADAAVDSKDEGRKTRALRKNALKEPNYASATESVDPDILKPVRTTRRTKKFAENAEEAPDPSTQDEVQPSKAKKKKKKRVEIEDSKEEPPKEAELKAGSKKKSKKKKVRKSNSVVIENVEQEPLSAMNTSKLSVDSFHSAAGSPRNTDIESAELQSEEEVPKGVEVRKTRSSIRSDSLTNNESDKKQYQRRKSSLKVNGDALFLNDCDNVIDQNIVNGLSSSKLNNTHNSSISFEEKLNTSTRKSRRATFDKTATPKKINTTFDNDAKIISDETFSVNEDIPKEVLKSTFDGDATEVKGRRKSAINALTQITNTNKSTPRKSNSIISISNYPKISIEDIVVEPEKTTTIVENPPATSKGKKSLINTTFERVSEPSSENDREKNNETFEVTSSDKSADEFSSSIKDAKHKSLINTTFEKDPLDTKALSHNSTFDLDSNKEIIDSNKRSSMHAPITDNTIDNDSKNHDTTFDKQSKSSIMTSDSSMMTLDKSSSSRISITSDESKNEENILNTTPVLIESSLDDSTNNVLDITQTKDTPVNSVPAPITPLKREGTFTKDEPEVMKSPVNTPTKRMSLPSAGFTPFHVTKSSSKEKSVLLNVTRSVEKRRSSLLEPPRTTKVMFCSPMDNPIVASQIKRKVIKSNLKGSNKSFVFDESACVDTRPAVGSRKRSYTQNDADDAKAKRKRLASDLQESVNRLSRPRTSSASAKLAEPITPCKKPQTPSKKSAGKVSRTKLPDFAALHQKRFDKMESLDECQERRARRAKQLLTPTGAVNVLERISPKEKPAITEKPAKIKDKSEKPAKHKEPAKPETPIKSLPTLKSLNPGYTRFGFKLNLDVNPFSIPSKPKPKENKANGLIRQPTLPSLTGATGRRELAKQAVLKENTSARRSEKRAVNRTVIKGVRTNRRFELQMRMRDI